MIKVKPFEVPSCKPFS